MAKRLISQFAFLKASGCWRVGAETSGFVATSKWSGNPISGPEGTTINLLFAMSWLKKEPRASYKENWRALS